MREQRRIGSLPRCGLAVVLVGWGVACGGDPSTSGIVLADSYDITGVGHVLPDGVAATSLFSFSWRWVELKSSGGRATGKLVVPDRNLEISLQGELDQEGNVTFTPFEAALTGTVSEVVEQLGGTAFDTSPKDGVGEDLSGFLRTIHGPRVITGSFLAAQRGAMQPARPDTSKLTTTIPSFAVAKVSGAAGSVVQRGLVEAFVHYLTPGAPRFYTFVADADGAFSGEVEALEGDLVIVRVRVAGAASEGVVLRVGPG
ncbi:MAG: hypothetical protein IT384_25185 [Deltaproteobacteria bacterium]|nr:hypothetical protein [Deltaproteobacteria bacterium]